MHRRMGFVAVEWEDMDVGQNPETLCWEIPPLFGSF